MQQDTFTLYKLIILYMLTKSKSSLNKGMIEEFILDKGYTNYITLQQALSELIENDLVQQQSENNRVLLTPTSEGAITLSYFENRISDVIKDEANAYLREKGEDIKKTQAITANYYKSTLGEYEVELIVKEKETTLIDLKLSVPTEEIAENICLNWEQKSLDVYKEVTKLLF